MKNSRIIAAVLSASIMCTSMTFMSGSVSAQSKDVTFDSNNIVMSMGSLSDIHYNETGNTGGHDDKLAKAIKTFQSIAGGADKLDALTISGDLTDYGKDAEHQKIKKILDANLTSNTQLVLAPGNHDSYPTGTFSEYNPYAKNYGNLVYQKPIEGNTPEQILRGNYHTVINGVHFISVLSLDGDMQPSDVKWLDSQLALAQKADPTKPIIVLKHVHPWKTNYGSHQLGEGNQRWQDKKGVEVLKKYPQAVSFTGHTHFPVTDDSTLWQEQFTSINTGSMRYMSIEENFAETGSSQEGIPGNDKVSNGQMLQLDKNGVVKITRYNLATGNVIGEQIKQPWVFKTMQSTDDAVYTQAARSELQHPYFPEDAKFNVSGSAVFNSASFKVNFSHALAPADMVQHYRLAIKEKATQEEVALVRSYTKFFFYLDPEKDMPKEEKTLNISASGLKSNTEYELTVCAVDSFGNQSKPLVHSFKSDVYSDQPIFDFGYKPIIDFESWETDVLLGKIKGETNPKVDYNENLAQSAEVSVVNSAMFDKKSLQVKSLSRGVAQTIKVNVNQDNQSLSTNMKDPKFITFMLDTTLQKSPTLTMNVQFTDGKTTYKMANDAPLMFFNKDGYTNYRTSNANGDFALSKGEHIRVVLPITAFRPESGSVSAEEAIKNIKSVIFKFNDIGFAKSIMHIDDVGVLVPKNETGSVQPPLLTGEVQKPNFVLGDLTGDGEVKTVDALLILRHIAKTVVLTEQQILAADYDQDGNVRTVDVLKILRKIAGM